MLNHICTHNMTSNITLNNVFTYDPTRTLTLRNRFASDMSGRFRRLITRVNQAVVLYDVFGLKSTPPPLFLPRINKPITIPREFIFKTDAEKVTAFMLWLREQVNAGILEVFPPSFEAVPSFANFSGWTEAYIRPAVIAGETHAQTYLNRLGLAIPVPGIIGSFGSSLRADRIALLNQRVFTELEGVTAAMEQQIARVLSGGLIAGANPEVIAREMANRIEAIGITRARLIARTEIIRAHHLANISEFERAGILNVVIQAEWTTAGDGHVCPLCRPLEDKVFTIDAIRLMIPRHPL